MRPAEREVGRCGQVDAGEEFRFAFEAATARVADTGEDPDEMATLAARVRFASRIRDRFQIGRTGLFVLAGIVPALVVFFVAVTFWSSLVEQAGTNSAFTLKHYAAVYTDAFTYTALINTAWFASVTVVVALFFGLPIAWLVERTDFPHKTLLHALMVVSIIVPTFIVAMGWILLLHPRIGFLNQWMQMAFGPGAVINISSVTGMGFVQGTSLAPLAFIMTAAAFKAMNPALEEAAEVHGMSRAKIMWRVTLPLVSPAILAAAIYIFVIGVAAFDVPAVIGLANRVYTFSTLIYVLALSPEDVPQYGIPAAVGFLMFIVALLLTIWYSRVIRASERYQIVSGRGYEVKRVPLGRWRPAAWGFCGLFMLLGIGIPLLLVTWTSLLPFLQPPSLRALQFVSFDQYRNIDWSLVLRGAKNTALLMLIVSTTTVFLAIPVAWVVIRSRTWWRFVIEFLVFLPHAMPAIIFGVAALLAGLFVLGDVIPIHGTIWIIAIVYVVERLTFCSRVLNGSFIQIHDELEEVGYVSGMNAVAVLRRVFVPLILPAVLAVWLWTALVIYRELTVATVLFNPKNVTLPVIVWNFWTAGGMGPASAVTMVMLAVLMPLVLIYWFTAGRRFMGW